MLKIQRGQEESWKRWEQVTEFFKVGVSNQLKKAEEILDHAFACEACEYEPGKLSEYEPGKLNEPDSDKLVPGTKVVYRWQTADDIDSQKVEAIGPTEKVAKAVAARKMMMKMTWL